MNLKPGKGWPARTLSMFFVGLAVYLIMWAPPETSSRVVYAAWAVLLLWHGIAMIAEERIDYVKRKFDE